ncbi:alpha/beta fold hydrolase [Pseudonocardia asaccharolytica]|uniref:Alpha/beta hydrolase n=1 Tax=Pseudonocardia asaccharolytica DSM 44247 = NBRC 16224 TaxID=1123024 RepID=A0A511D787_9PSEU|nr:alpha/beta hydrolase [Pseudonocardia asaccharolytica]GEL20681.1 alpha/beta hydrolase [Pseudonocardia asaccharolytica DSM 44247 = NBRC 16224]
MSSIAVNGTTLYYELRGEGPPVLFISGATGDAGHWTEVADALANDYTILAYDRRANSRSPRPENWATAPIDEQADDAAELLKALGLAPAVAYGNSQGAIILTSLVLRHPDVLRAAIFHEPPYAAITSDPEAVTSSLQTLVSEGTAEGGPALAMERFVRWAAGDEAYEAFDPEMRARMLGNAEVFFGIELEGIFAYIPTSEQLGQVRLPCVVAAGVDNREPTATHHWMYEASQWLAGQLGASFIETPGAHVPQATHPRALAELLRPLIDKLPASRA